MIKKCILIKPTNVEYLSQRFGAGAEDREPLIPGWVLIAPFNSEDAEYDLLTPGQLREKYVYTGRKLENDFLEVRTRELV